MHRIILLVSRQKRFEGDVSSLGTAWIDADDAAESHGSGKDGSIRAFGPRRDVGEEALGWRSGARCSRHRDDNRHGAREGDRCTKVANAAVLIVRGHCARIRVQGNASIAVHLMAVLVVAQMLLRRDARFVRTVPRRAPPDYLERDRDQQKDQ
jgi:hypothetical protein